MHCSSYKQGHKKKKSLCLYYLWNVEVGVFFIYEHMVNSFSPSIVVIADKGSSFSDELSCLVSIALIEDPPFKCLSL